MNEFFLFAIALGAFGIWYVARHSAASEPDRRDAGGPGAGAEGDRPHARSEDAYDPEAGGGDGGGAGD
ncbi:MAG: hypothetical protein ACK4YP_26960 [Myxococcota bacterium]